MLSGEGMQRQKTMKNNNRSNQQKQLCTRSTIFFTFLCRCFAATRTWNFQKLLSTCSCSFLFTAAHFHLALVAVAFLILSPSLQNFHVVLPTKKSFLPFFISRSKSLSPFFSLSFAGLPPTFSFSLSFSCSIFQICGRDNLSKLNTLDNTDTVTISSFRFRLYCLFCCLWRRWLCEFPPN